MEIGIILRIRETHELKYENRRKGLWRENIFLIFFIESHRHSSRYFTFKKVFPSLIQDAKEATRVIECSLKYVANLTDFLAKALYYQLEIFI